MKFCHETKDSYEWECGTFTVKHATCLIYAYSIRMRGNKQGMLFSFTHELKQREPLYTQLDYSQQITAMRTEFFSRVETNGFSLFT
jgi:hypothetical protein